jgi:hypothetical protein
MKKKSLALTGTLAALVATTIAEVTPATPPVTPKQKKTGAKRVPMARVFIGDAIAMLSDAPESVAVYVRGFLKLPVRARAGYDNFWSKDDGFTNAQKFRTITPQGVGKMMAVLQYRAASIIAAGGDNATLMQNILNGIEENFDTALADATHEHEQAALNVAFGELVEALDGNAEAAREKLAKYAADKGLELPADPTPVQIADDEIEGDEVEETADDEAETVDA